MSLIELKRFLQFTKYTSIQISSNALTLLSNDGRKGRFAFSKLFRCIATASQELTAIHINCKGITSSLVFQALPRSLIAIHILCTQQFHFAVRII